jgi:hypothetical protein
MVSNSLVTLQRTVAVLILLLLYAANANTYAAKTGDFGFRFEIGDCPTERLDTFNGVFTKSLGGEPAHTVAAHISLTDAQMATIYRAIDNIGFFNLPATFDGVPAGLREVTTTVPYTTYRLEVRHGGIVHAVVWKDAYKPTTAKADRLRDLFSMMLGFIHEHPEFKRLPRATVDCE